MSRYPWRDTSTDIAGGQPPQWETPQGAQVKADKALEEANAYTDEKTETFMDHVSDTTIHVTPADKANWNSKAPGVHTHVNATPTVPGFMSAEDKTKLNGVEAEANKYVHPASHPPAIIAQDSGNRFVSDAEKASWSGKAETSEATTVAKGLMSPTDKQKLNGIQAAAEVNQNAFSGVNGVVATSKSDTLQIAGGTGITISEDPVTKRLTVTATGDATPGAHASSHITGGTDVIPDAVIGGSSGLMSGADAKFVRQDGESKTEAQAKADAAKQAANEYTDQKVGEIVIDDASLTQKGIVQLSDATDGSRSDIAATEKAVGLAFQAGNERKAEVVAALVAIGVPASTSESWDQLIPKIAAVIRATGSATPAQVMSGATFSNVTGNNRTGAMPDNGAVTQNITNQNGAYVVPEGYHNGSGVVQAVITNLIAGNIRTGITVGGVPGTFTGSISPGSGPIFRRTNYVSSNSSTPYEAAGIVFNLPGTIRISFDLYTSSTNARAQIYKNGVPFGTLRSSSSSTPTTYVQDITFVAGDKISVYLWAVGSSASIEKIIYGATLFTITQE